MKMSGFLNSAVVPQRLIGTDINTVDYSDINKKVTYGGWYSIASTIYVENMQPVDAFKVDGNGNTFHELRVSAKLQELMLERCNKNISADAFLHMCHLASFSDNAIAYIAEQCHNLETNA